MTDLLLGGLPEAVEELHAFREAYEKFPTTENKVAIRFSELSVIQMAEALIDRFNRSLKDSPSSS